MSDVIWVAIITGSVTIADVHSSSQRYTTAGRIPIQHPVARETRGANQ